MFVHVNVGGVLALIVFQFLLVATSLAAAVVLGTGNLSVLGVVVVVHGFYFFIFGLSQINYTK
jgi:hypothetical protein